MPPAGQFLRRVCPPRADACRFRRRIRYFACGRSRTGPSRRLLQKSARRGQHAYNEPRVRSDDPEGCRSVPQSRAREGGGQGVHQGLGERTRGARGPSARRHRARGEGTRRVLQSQRQSLEALTRRPGEHPGEAVRREGGAAARAALARGQAVGLIVSTRDR